jgi:hypothetical protein
MKSKSSRTTKKKTKLGLPDLDQANELSSAACVLPIPSGEINILSMNSSTGIVPNLAYEAADSGLLSPELAAGIWRVKGARRLGIRLGNWLTADQARTLWQLPRAETLGKRDRAILSILLGCGLRRRELAELTIRLLSESARDSVSADQAVVFFCGGGRWGSILHIAGEIKKACGLPSSRPHSDAGWNK